ncbi:MAG: hypothetical protein JNL13_02265 [Chitinophagaceae bacterium]|nr:hypothetical protein [Chitinophagaceae bacterium]
MTIRIDPDKRFFVGDELSPGGWYNSLKDTLNSKEIILFEQHLETLRSQHNPKAVSRSGCVFSFDTHSAENFLHALGRDKAANHNVVELSYDPTTPVSEHNYSVISYFFQCLQNGGTLPLLLAEEDLMIQYWTGNAMTLYNSATGPLPYNAEILIGGPARVVSIR